MIGDFNSILNMDEKMGNKEKDSIDYNLKMINTLNLIDVPTNFDKRAHTYISQKDTSLIDRMIISKDMTDKIKHYDTEICPFSDHNAIVTNIGRTTDIKLKRHNRYRTWKPNISLLSDNDTKSKIADFWHDWRLTQDNYDQLLTWNIKGKERLKNILVKLGKEKAKRRQNEEITIRNELKDIMNNQTHDTDRLIELKSKLNKIEDYTIEGLKIG